MIRFCLYIVFFIGLFIHKTYAQERPRIWVKASDKAQILENIDQHAWAANLKKQLEEHVKPYSQRHARNPEFLLSRLPRTWGGNNYTTADLTKKNADRPFLTSGNAPIPTFHRSDDFIVRTKTGKSYDYPGIDGMIPYNKHPTYGMTLTVSNTNRTEFVPYLARFLRTLYTEVLILGVDSATLYYLTGNSEYAQLSADILHAFVEPLEFMQVVQSSRTHADGIFITDFLRDARITMPMLPLMYDMIYPFLQKRDTRVFDAVTKTRKKFNDAAAQKTFTKLAQTVLDKGITQSNWSILEGNGFLYNVLSIKNKKERDRLFNIFYNEGTRRHDAFKWSINNYTHANIWPEPLRYAFDVNNRMLKMMAVMDHNKDILNVDVLADSKQLLKGAFLFESLQYPDKTKMRFGDATNATMPVGKVYNTVELIAKRIGNVQYQRLAQSAAAQYYKETGYNPKIVFERLGYDSPLQLLWGQHVDLDQAEPLPKDDAVHLSFAGIMMQRNENTHDIQKNGLMYYTGGSTYVHAHASGIDLELYGNGLVMGVEYGTGNYGTDLHNNYATKHAAHNTVIVNGGSKRGGKTWEDVMSPVKLVAAEPASFAKAVSSNFSFSCQDLDDTYNAVKQQRCVAMVRTSDTSGYYVDLFRSVSKNTTQFSDYLYHNIGDTTVLNRAGTTEALYTQPTPERYQNDIGDANQQPGWRYFENTRSSLPTKGAITAQFQLNEIKQYMNAHIPNDAPREISLATGPQTLGTPFGYHRKPTQVMTIRKQGEAWDAPFVVVYEPSTSKDNSPIQSFELIKYRDKVIGVTVVSNVGQEQIIDHIIMQDNADSVYENPQLDLTFNGRMAIARERIRGDSSVLGLYVGDGTALSFKGKALSTSDVGYGFKAVSSPKNKPLPPESVQSPVPVIPQPSEPTLSEPTPIVDDIPAPINNDEPMSTVDEDPTPVVEQPNPTMDSDPMPIVDEQPKPVVNANPVPVINAQPTPTLTPDVVSIPIVNQQPIPTMGEESEPVADEPSTVDQQPIPTGQIPNDDTTITNNDPASDEPVIAPVISNENSGAGSISNSLIFFFMLLFGRLYKLNRPHRT